MQIEPETPEEKSLARQVLLGVNDKADVWSIADCLLNRVALESCFGIPETRQPSTAATEALKLDPRLIPYQISDVEKMFPYQYVLDANPMGYGKTVEALQWCKAKGYRKILILCPKSIRTQWKHAIADWYDPKLTVSITPKTIQTDIVITNYEQLIRSQMYFGITWDCVVADEVHRVRNTDSQTSAAARRLRSKARIGLTGTPIMSRPDDLWGICLFIHPSYLGTSYWNFVNAYCKIEENFWGKKITGAVDDPVRKDILKKTLDIFWVRNPQNIFGQGFAQNDVILDMYPAQAKIYKDIRRLAIDELDKIGVNITNGMSQMMHLQRVTTIPGAFEGYKGGNIKFEWIKDLLTDNPELKICVFSKFRQAIVALQQYLGIDQCVTIHGEVKNIDRDKAIKDFTTKESIRTIAGTIGAMSEGIDGLQTVAHTVIFLDSAWNPEENNQAIARLARMGQNLRVNVYMLYCDGTVDQYAGKVALNKMETIKELIWRESTSI